MIKWKPIFYRLLALSLPFFLLFLAEVVLRLIPGLDSSKYVDVGPFSLFSKVQINGREHYKVTYKHAYADRNVSFPVEKVDQTIRIFCLGGSASAGWPHPSQEIYSMYLEQALGNAFPEHTVEVINVSAHGFASYRVRTIFDKIIDLSPNIVVVYSGNNEFLELRPYVRSGFFETLAKLAFKLKTVSLLQGLFHKAVLSGTELEGVAEFFWKKVQREALQLRKDPQLFEKVKEHYAESIGYMAAESERRHIPLFFLTVPVNLRDWLPNVSDNPLGGERFEEWERIYNLGRKHLLLGESQKARQALQQATAVNPQHAESHFWLGRALEAEVKYQEALQSYQEAKDLDYNPFRAHSDFNKSLRKIAAQNEGSVFLIDLEQVFAERAHNGLPGFDLFLDYVHPTKVGNLIIAEEVYNAILKNNLLEFPAGRTDFYRRDVVWRRDGRLYREERDFLLHRDAFWLSCLTHQYDAAIAKAELIKTLLVEHRSELKRVGALPKVLPEQVSDALKVFTAYQQVKRKELLGVPVTADEKQLTEKLHEQFFKKWYKYEWF